MFWRLLIGLFLALHALVFAFLEPESWLFDGGSGIFLTLGVVAAGLLTVGAIGLVGDGDRWRIWVGAGAGLSLVQLLLFLEPGLLAGVAIDVAILAGVAWSQLHDAHRTHGTVSTA